MSSVYELFHAMKAEEKTYLDTRNAILASGRDINIAGDDEQDLMYAMHETLVSNASIMIHNDYLSRFRQNTLTVNDILDLGYVRSYGMKFSKKRREAYNKKVDDMSQLFPAAEGLRVKSIFNYDSKESITALCVAFGIGISELVNQGVDQLNTIAAGILVGVVLASVTNGHRVPSRNSVVNKTLVQYRELSKANKLHARPLEDVI